jgi:uncharacterized protein YndB with AHSA1/START domain
MPANKDWKRLVRARMQETGESYTTARMMLLRKPPPRRTGGAPPSASPAKPKTARAPRASAIAAIDYGALAGISDTAVAAKTGCGWERWVKALDHKQAHTWPHSRIAEFVHEKYKIPGWWAQMVTVGYERIKGLRAVGQRRSGDYEASRSKTFAVPLPRLYAAFAVDKQRRRWLGDVGLTVRKATRDRSLRITWSDGSPVELMFFGKGPGKSQVQVQHRKLKDRAALEKAKDFWGERFAALAEEIARS